MIDLIAKEVERGKIEKNIRDLIAKSMKDFYEYLWMNRSVWETKIKK